MSRTLPYLLAASVVTITGLVQGYATDRWSMSHDLRDAATRISLIPISFDGWDGQTKELDQKELDAAGIVGGLLRRYTNLRTGRSVSVFIVCGRPGPISVHTPDVCYSGAGYALSKAQARIPLQASAESAKASEFWWSDFEKQNSIVPNRLRIFWAWSIGKGWESPDNPRLTFADSRYLYKLYVIREANEPLGPVEVDSTADFLKNFLPVLNRFLFSDARG